MPNEFDLPDNENDFIPQATPSAAKTTDQDLPDPEADEFKEAVAATPVTNLAAAMNPVGAIRDLPAAGVSLDETALATKKILAAQPKVPFIIPLDPGETPGAYRAVIINGYRFEVKKNVMVYLPMAVAKLLMECYNVENTVLNNHPNNLSMADGEKRRALGV